MFKEKLLEFGIFILELLRSFVQFLFGWTENLLDNLISVKVWFLATCVYLCIHKFITGGEFITAFGIVVGAREGYKIARSYFAPKLTGGAMDGETERKLKKI